MRQIEKGNEGEVKNTEVMMTCAVSEPLWDYSKHSFWLSYSLVAG